MRILKNLLINLRKFIVRVRKKMGIGDNCAACYVFPDKIILATYKVMVVNIHLFTRRAEYYVFLTDE
jgi:hypothetical protein